MFHDWAGRWQPAGACISLVNCSAATDTGVSSRAPRFYALNACAIQQAHTRGNLTSTVCCFGKPCPNTRLQLLCVLVSSLEPYGIVPPSSGRTVLQVPMGQADCAKTQSQSVDRSSLHTFGAVWIKPHAAARLRSAWAASFMRAQYSARATTSTIGSTAQLLWSAIIRHSTFTTCWLRC